MKDDDAYEVYMRCADARDAAASEARGRGDSVEAKRHEMMSRMYRERAKAILRELDLELSNEQL